MEERLTRVYISNSLGDVIINNLPDDACIKCIRDHSHLEGTQFDCQLNSTKKRVYAKETSGESILICDDKEKSRKNFASLVEMITHSTKGLLSLADKVKSESRLSVTKEINSFKHNIEHINSNALNEFYTFVPQDDFVKNYRGLRDLVSKEIRNNHEGATDLISHLSRYNLNIKTELSVTSILNTASSPSFSQGNPRNAIMINVYMLYPAFKERQVYVDVDEFRDKIILDFEALQVASYYIIQNASKYTEEESRFEISFSKNSETIEILFKMKSIYIDEETEKLMFNEGYKGELAKKTEKSGKGIGLYRAKRLINFCKGTLSVEPGTDKTCGSDGLYYANNIFTITLPKDPNSIK